MHLSSPLGSVQRRHTYVQPSLSTSYGWLLSVWICRPRYLIQPLKVFVALPLFYFLKVETRGYYVMVPFLPACADMLSFGIYKSGRGSLSNPLSPDPAPPPLSQFSSQLYSNHHTSLSITTSLEPAFALCSSRIARIPHLSRNTESSCTAAERLTKYARAPSCQG